VYTPEPFLAMFKASLFLPKKSYVQGMNIMDIAGGVLAANLLTVLFVWGGYHATRPDEDIPWSAYGAMAFPIVFTLISLAVAGETPF
jgi:hypothetical protein